MGGVVLEDAQGNLVGAVLVGDGGAVRMGLDPEPESEVSSAGSGVVPEDVVWIDHPVGRRGDVRVEKAETEQVWSLNKMLLKSLSFSQ